jgi:hypothetical protein
MQLKVKDIPLVDMSGEVKPQMDELFPQDIQNDEKKMVVKQ